MEKVAWSAFDFYFKTKLFQIIIVLIWNLCIFCNCLIVDIKDNKKINIIFFLYFLLINSVPPLIFFLSENERINLSEIFRYTSFLCSYLLTVLICIVPSLNTWDLIEASFIFCRAITTNHLILHSQCRFISMYEKAKFNASHYECYFWIYQLRK
jgi:hypothetical protein